MNAGLGNLDSLKRHLLANTLGSETRFDAVILDIGLGVESAMANECNRHFRRMAGDTAVFQADRASFILPRYPLEAVTLVELKLKDSDDFVAQASSFIQSTSKASGIVYLPEHADAARYWAQVRFTYTGGFWWEELEPDDDGYPSAQPAGSKKLPNDLRLAWLIQCREVWAAADKLGGGLVDKPQAQTALSELDWAPMVKRTLGSYQLMQPI